ncbi:MAG: aminoglycoside phosphotransferase family protein [Acidimicrobiales bacterium]
MTPIDLARAAVLANGYEWGEPRVLQSTNAMVVHLETAGVVVKAGQWPDSQPGMLREHAVCGEVRALGEPGPEALGKPWTDNETGMVATLWTYMESVPIGAPDPSELAVCLGRVHCALRQTVTALPDYREWFDLFARSLYSDNEMANLEAEDRHDLRIAYGALRPRIDRHHSTPIRIHGEPHLGNHLRTDDGLILIDFETACVGPPEWDLASLDPAVARHYEGSLDDEFLGLLRTMNDVRIATWCFGNPTPAEHELGRRCLERVRTSSLEDDS